MLPLTSIRLLVVIGALCLLAVGGAVFARRVLPSHPVLLRLLSSGVALVLLTAGVGAGVNRHFGLYRTWRDLTGTHSPDLVSVHGLAGLRAALASLPAGAPIPVHGTLFAIRIPGPVSGVKPRAAFVYVPPQYRDPAYATATFPVVEAFQGSPGRPSDWIRGLHLDRVMDAAIRRGTVAPSIVVMPDTNGGLARSLECADTADGKNDEAFLVSDVHAWVAANLRATVGRWVALGYSTGGYCSLDLSLRHPNQFYAAVSLDGYSHALKDHYARGIWHSVADRLSHSPDWWVGSYPPEPVNFYLLAGLSDPSSVRDAVRFWGVLRRFRWQGPRDRLVVQAGGKHTFPAWEAALAPALEWALPGPAARDPGQSPVDTKALLAALPKQTPAPAAPSPTCASVGPGPRRPPVGPPSVQASSPGPCATPSPSGSPGSSGSSGAPGPPGPPRRSPGPPPRHHPRPAPSPTPAPAPSPSPSPRPSPPPPTPTPRPSSGAHQ